MGNYIINEEVLKDLREFNGEWDESIYIDTRFIGRKKLEYAILFGNEKIVFIKAGAGGSACGYRNKYFRMARRIHALIGATVICAPNPRIIHEDLDEEEIRKVIEMKNFSDFQMHFVGSSDGAYKNLTLARRFPQTVKLLSINSSFIELPDLAYKLSYLGDVSKILVFGTRDYDYKEVLPLKDSKIPNLRFISVSGANHIFEGKLEEFIALIDLLAE